MEPYDDRSGGRGEAFSSAGRRPEKDLLYFDSLQSICSIDDYKIVKPGPGDMEKFIAAIDRVAHIADEEMLNAASPYP